MANLSCSPYRSKYSCFGINNPFLIPLIEWLLKIVSWNQNPPVEIIISLCNCGPFQMYEHVKNRPAYQKMQRYDLYGALHL